MEDTDLFIVFKSTRVYYGGPGYQNYQPAEREKAALDAAELTRGNGVGFVVLPYTPPVPFVPLTLPNYPMENFDCLTTKKWLKDKGFAQVIKGNPGMRMFKDQELGLGRADAVAYWRKEKSDLVLWQLLLYMGEHTIPQTLAHFGLPADTAKFLRWCSDDVAHAEREKVPGMAQGFAAGFDQMNFFPYPALYEIWKAETNEQRIERSLRRGNVQVYVDRITEPTGEVLATL